MNLELDQLELACDSRAELAGSGRLMEAKGTGRERAAVAARGAPAITPAVGSRAPGSPRGHWPTRVDSTARKRAVGNPALWRRSGGGGRWGHRRFARLAPMTRRRAVDAANGGQWPPRRGEELPRALTQHAAGPRCVPNGPPGCHGERGMARAAATLGIIGLRWPPRAPPNML